MFSKSNKKSKTSLSLNPTRNTWFKNISRLLRKDTISSDSWDEAIELLVASDISYSTASNLVEEAQEAYENSFEDAIANGFTEAEAEQIAEQVYQALLAGTSDEITIDEEIYPENVQEFA